jgi:hypothetical protein
VLDLHRRRAAEDIAAGRGQRDGGEARGQASRSGPVRSIRFAAGAEAEAGGENKEGERVATLRADRG